MKKIHGNSVDCVITSPPYNMRLRVLNNKYITRENTDSKSREVQFITRKYSEFDDAFSIEDYYEFHKKAIKEMLRVSHIVFYVISIVTGSKEALFKLIGHFNKEIKDIVIWDKGFGQPAIHGSILNRGYEFVIILESNAKLGRAFSKSYFARGTMQDIWRIGRSKSKEGHNACFPEELVSTILKGWTKEGDMVLDPFAGTGTTGIMCKSMNRNFILIEKQQKYVDLINKRLGEVRCQQTMI
ncbi:MAG: site-specific DNA-methyltransferase [Candidatus Woesebacteria bacterium]|nr:site-specific DNA-methyltransferase [Candidatus Woesebacteria bacterium]